MTDKEKILKYLDSKGINKNQFSVKTGLSTRFFSSGNSLGVDKLRVIANNYTDLSIDWVVLDKGEMIKKSSEITILNEDGSDYPNLKDKKIQELEKKIAEQKTYIEELRNDKKVLQEALREITVLKKDNRKMLSERGPSRL